jgi:hypothetical protein
LFVVGHVAKGLVFCMIGGLGSYAAIKGASDPQGMVDVLVWLHAQAFGKALVALLGTGLLAHGVWRWVEAFHSEARGRPRVVVIGERVGHAIGGTFYALLAYSAFSLLWFKPPTGAQDGSSEEVLRSTLAIPWGEWIVGLVGAIIIVIGIGMATNGVRKHMTIVLEQDHMKAWETSFYRTIGLLGFLAWGLVNGIIGYFLIRVALTSQPERFRGFKGALEFVGGRTYGALLLGALSLGLLLFGLFLCAKAHYQRQE